MTTPLDYLSNPNYLKSAAELLIEAVDQYVVRPTGATNQTVGVSGFVFQILDDEHVSLDSEITDHYIETNYAVQDHIALRPERFTLRGYVGELNDVSPQYLSIAIAALERVIALASMGPNFTAQAEQIYAAVMAAIAQSNDVVNAAASLYNLFTLKSTTANNQQNAFNYFYSMWLTRQLCTVETPWQIFQNMAIERISVTQRGESRIVSDFAVTFKKIRIAQTVTIQNPLASLKRFANLVESYVSLGPVVGNDAFWTAQTSDNPPLWFFYSPDNLPGITTSATNGPNYQAG